MGSINLVFGELELYCGTDDVGAETVVQGAKATGFCHDDQNKWDSSEPDPIDFASAGG